MSNRRVFLGALVASSDRIISEADGVAGEVFETEVYMPYGFWSRPDAMADAGETVLFEINGDPDNHIAMPPSSAYMGEEGTIGIAYGDDVRVTLSEDCVLISVGESTFSIKDGEITTDMNIRTTGDICADGDIKAGGDVIAGVTQLVPIGVSLKTHVHPETGGVTGQSQ